MRSWSQPISDYIYLNHKSNINLVLRYTKQKEKKKDDVNKDMGNMLIKENENYHITQSFNSFNKIFNSKTWQGRVIILSTRNLPGIAPARGDFIRSTKIVSLAMPSPSLHRSGRWWLAKVLLPLLLTARAYCHL